MAQKSMKGIFQDLARNRQAKAAAAKQWVVLRVKKNGQPSQVTALDQLWNMTDTHEAATARQQELERLNPGKTYCIVAL